MTALYFIPIVAIVIAATSGALVASALQNSKHQLWTLIISYIFWSIGTPLSWIILTVYFLRLTIHKPLQREVIVSLLLPIGPLGLEGFSYVYMCFQNSTSSSTDLIWLQVDITWKSGQTRLSSDRYCSSCHQRGRRVLSPRLNGRPYPLGLCFGVVHCRHHHDSNRIPFSVQYGMVGLHIPCW